MLSTAVHLLLYYEPDERRIHAWLAYGIDHLTMLHGPHWRQRSYDFSLAIPTLAGAKVTLSRHCTVITILVSVLVSLLPIVTVDSCPVQLVVMYGRLVFASIHRVGQAELPFERDGEPLSISPFSTSQLFQSMAITGLAISVGEHAWAGPGLSESITLSLSSPGLPPR